MPIPPKVPTAIHLIVGGAIVSIVLLIGLPAWMALDRASLGQSIMEKMPDLDPSRLDIQINLAILYAAVLHAVDVVLLIWFTLRVVRGRGWARIALTVYLVIATGLGLFSATAGTEYLLVVIATDIVHLIMLVLLWLPRSVREHFAARRSDRTTATA